MTLSVGENPDLKAHLFYLDGMVSRSDIGELIVRPLMVSPRLRSAASVAEAATVLDSGILYFPDQRKITDITQVISMIPFQPRKAPIAVKKATMAVFTVTMFSFILFSSFVNYRMSTWTLVDVIL